MTVPRSEGRRQLGLDVVRASAILLVMLGHYSVHYAMSLQLPRPSGAIGVAGFFGVQLFFPLSGYLIGRIMFDIAEQGASPGMIGRFWLRRWMRTIPAYLVALAFTAYVMTQWYGFRDYNLLQFATLTQNLVTPFDGKFFGVSWSLGVEEWFYIFFPIVLFGTLLYVPRRGTSFVLAAFVILPIVSRYIMWRWHNDYWQIGGASIVPLNLDSIAYGAVAAYVVRDRMMPDRLAIIIGCVGISLFGLTWYLYATGGLNNDFGMSNGRYLGASISGALLVVAFGNLQRAPTILSGIARFFSAHAYTLYLVHDLGYVWSHSLLDRYSISMWTPILGTAFVIAFAMALTRFVEIPFMRARPKQFATSTAFKKPGYA